MPEPVSVESTIGALVAMSGIAPTDDELTAMTDGFAAIRRMVDSLYAMPGVRYEEPAVIFNARP